MATDEQEFEQLGYSKAVVDSLKEANEAGISVAEPSPDLVERTLEHSRIIGNEQRGKKEGNCLYRMYERACDYVRSLLG
jgi:hypothetical protein